MPEQEAPYDPYIPSGGNAAATAGNQQAAGAGGTERTKALQAVSIYFKPMQTNATTAQSYGFCLSKSAAKANTWLNRQHLILYPRYLFYQNHDDAK